MSGGTVEVHPSAYTPRVNLEWELDSPNALWREVDASCCFVDISGFTALSERLARRGRIGAEELTEVLNHVFSRMLGVAYSKGGALLKFGGDALLLMFARGDHPVLAAQAAVAMRATLREARTLPTSVGRVNLKMSVGIHSGTFHLFRVGESHKELIITGPGASATTRMEQIAEAGEIVVSADTAARLPKAALGAHKGDGRLLSWRKVVDGGPGPVPPREVPALTVQNAIPAALRQRLSDRSGESEHRVASVAFVKFHGIDQLLATEGPESTARALHQIVSTVQDGADAESVTFLASDIDANGGKIILVSGVPTAQEDDDGRLLRAARTILSQTLPLPVRIGANHGHVFAGDIGTDYRRTFTIMGDTVNLAARLMAAASPGDLYVTAGILDHSRTAFQTEALEPFMVKGKAHPVQAYRVGEPTGTRGLEAGDLPFRGRNEELSAVLELFKLASEGHGRVAAIEAERGAGKSRLMSELITSANAPTVLVLQGEPHAGAVPYLPLREPVRRLIGIDAKEPRDAGRQLTGWFEQNRPDLAPFVPLLAPVVDAEVEPTRESAAVANEFVRDRIADALITILDSACTTPLLLVAEDAHWFDDTTSEVCARLVIASRERPWFLCVARRSGTSGFCPLDPDLTLQLKPLDEEAARQLLELATEAVPLRPQERDAILSRAGGNPLFLEELLRIVRNTEMQTLPDSLDAVAMREIDSLPAGARRALLLASVLGRSFDRGLLHELIASDGYDSDADPLAALDAQLVPDGEARLRFRHALLQEAAYQTLPFRSRLAMHRQVAEVIEAQSTRPAEVASLLSLHYVAAQLWDRAWKYARLAAESARNDHAPAEAAVHLERSVDAARHLREAASPADLGEVLVALGMTRELLGEYERADDAYRRAALVPNFGPRRQAELGEQRAYLRSEYQGRPAAAIRQLRSVAARMAALPVSQDDATWIRSALLAREADVRLRQGRFTEAIRCSNRAAEEAERTGHKKALALALSVLDEALCLTGRQGEATHLGRAVELYESLGDHIHAARAVSNLAIVNFYNSQWDAAVGQLHHAIERFTEAGDLADAAFAQFNLGDIKLNQGSWDAAETILSSARRTLEACGFRVGAAIATVALGRARIYLGHMNAGLELLRSGCSELDEVGTSAEQIESRARYSEALLITDEIAEARAALDDARRVELTSQNSMHSALLDRIEISLAMANGDVTDARARLPGSLSKARETGADYEVVMMLAQAEQLGMDISDGESGALRERLGVHRLPKIPMRIEASVVEADVDQGVPCLLNLGDS